MKSGDFLAPVQDELQRVEDLMRSQADDRHPQLEEALKHLLGSGGKRVRPGVVLLMGGILNGDRDRLVILSAAIELLHTATLVHDDLIDGSILRRGIATLNAQWSPAATVLTGDFIFSRAAMLAAGTDFIVLMKMFAETLTTIVSGEITQMFTSRGLANRENYEQRIFAKTASLFELASTAAALLSPVDDKVIEFARKFGYSIGMAFQIVDDVLDFTGEQATVGKPVASDLRQGLITLPALYFLEAHPNDKDMVSVMSSNHLSETVVARLVDGIRQSGAIERSIEEAQVYMQRGLDILETFPENAYRRALEDLTRYFVSRSM